MIEIEGRTITAHIWWDESDPLDAGWRIEYLLASNGDAVDDSCKIWHPRLSTDEHDVAGVVAIATAYIERLEAELDSEGESEGGAP